MTTTVYTIPETSTYGGFTVDLDRTQIDVLRTRWTWTGDLDHTGMPLMKDRDGSRPQRLSHVYEMLGPLIPAPLPVTAADRYAVLTAPTCTTTGRQDSTPATPLTFAGLLGRLRRRAS
ncbi:phiSA1p31-related protein [Streptomyces halstedii]|uniref:phiSA1p31-related protein n=1 Tax=Streptomyces halstedii TaxID=1944 RepID=UPI00382705E6